MAWRKPTEEDLTSRLSQNEITAFSRSSSFGTDAVEGVLAQAAGFARDAIRSGGRCGLSPVDGEIPDGLFRPVLAIAVLDLLTRINVRPNDTRIDAAKEAESYLREVASGKIVPESYANEGAVEPKAAGPLADDGPRRTLGGGLW